MMRVKTAFRIIMGTGIGKGICIVSGTSSSFMYMKSVKGFSAIGIFVRQADDMNSHQGAGSKRVKECGAGNGGEEAASPNRGSSGWFSCQQGIDCLCDISIHRHISYTDSYHFLRWLYQRQG